MTAPGWKPVKRNHPPVSKRGGWEACDRAGGVDRYDAREGTE